MPIYEYICEFGHLYEEIQSITKFDKNRVVECPECGNTMESYIGEPPLGFMKGEIKTVGQQGEANWKKLGKVRQEEMIQKNKEEKKAAEKQLLKEKGLDGASLPDYKRARKLANLTSDQKKKYIRTGKLPP